MGKLKLLGVSKRPQRDLYRFVKSGNIFQLIHKLLCELDVIDFGEADSRIMEKCLGKSGGSYFEFWDEENVFVEIIIFREEVLIILRANDKIKKKTSELIFETSEFKNLNKLREKKFWKG